MLHNAIERILNAQAAWADPLGKIFVTFFSALYKPVRPLKDFLNGVWFGHPLHPAITDVPIGAFFVALILDLSGQRAAATLAIGAGIVFMALAALAGYADYIDLERGVNDEFSGGEKKRAETLQLAVLQPKFAVLDEIDSGLDVDALRDVSRRVEAMTHEDDLGVLAITHYARLLTELRPDRVHVMLAGRVVQSGGPELADRLEQTGYEGIAAELGVEALTIEQPVAADPFSDPTIDSNPFA